MKIAIVKLSALGDIVHAMVVLQFMRLHNQKIKIDWIVEEEYAELLEFSSDIYQLHRVNLKRAKKRKSFSILINELLKTRKFGPYDMVIDLQGIIKSALIAKLVPSKITLGFDKLSAREGISSFFYNKVFNCRYDENIIIRNIQIINFALGINIEKKQIDQKKPYLISENYKDKLSLDTSRHNILLVPGASFKAKMYPAKKYAELVQKIDANFLLIWGNNHEKEIANEIASVSDNTLIIEKSNLLSLISLISKVDLVIGSDTGPTHMAWAMNIPSITLYGATPGYRNSYQTNNNKILESDSIVNPIRINKEDFSIRNIKVDDIVKMTRYLLKL